jgi:hypothetical protein
MKRTLFSGLALALAAVAAVYIGDALNLGLPNPYLGIAIGGVLALAPGGHKMGRLAGFLLGIVAALVGYAVSAGFMPQSNGGEAVVAFLIIALATAISLLGFGRMPLWSVLLGVVGYAGAYDWVFEDNVPEFLTTAPRTLGTFLVVFGLGYLTGALMDWLFPEESNGAEAEKNDDYATVGSEI